MKSVLMVGVSRSMQGGVASVVNSYYKIGLNNKVNMKYISTLKEGNIIKKLSVFIKAVIKILVTINNYDIVHIHMASRGSFLRKSIVVLIANIYRKKVIIHMHGAEFMMFYNDECNTIMKKYIRYIFKKADKVIALSNQWKNNLEKIVDKNKIVVINNGVIVEEDFLEKDYTEIVLLFLGRVGERKGIFDIIDIMPEIIKECKDVKLLVGGDGEIDELKEKCAQLKIEENVEILGWVNSDEKDILLKRATIFILPSYNEGMPMALLEVMACGISAISSNVGGIPQVIGNGKEGFIINPGDVSALKDRILELIKSENKRKEMGKNARRKMEKEFNLKNIKILLLDIYQSL